MKLPDNIGSNLGRKSAKGASGGGFQDIKINMFREGFSDRPRQIGWIVLTVLAILAIGGLVPVYQLYDKSNDETKLLERDIVNIEADIAQFGQETEIQKQIQEINDKVTKMQEAIPEKELIVPLVELLANGLPYAPQISSYDLGETSIGLSGNSETPDTLINYVRALESLDQFSKAHITNLGATTEGGKVEIVSETESAALEMTETVETLSEGTVATGPMTIDPRILQGGTEVDESTQEQDAEATQSIEVGTAPEVDLLPPTYLTPPEQEPVRVLLEATATSYDPIVLWEWDFGDGTTKTGVSVPRVFHDYTNEGDYSVSVTVYDAEGRKGMSIMAGMFEKPYADFTAEVVKCDDPLTVKLTDLSTSIGMLLSWEWDFDGDMVTDSTEMNPVYTFPSPGVHNVTLTVKGTLGQPDSQTKQLTAGSPPVADFLCTPTVSGSKLTVNFTDLSVPGDETDQLALWQWDFGDNTTSTERFPSHTYSSMGPYTVSLTVTESDGNCNTRTKTIKAISSTKTAFVAEAVGPLGVQFSNVSASSSNISCLWDFGDGYLSTEQDPSHTYAERGTYTVSLSIMENVSDPLDPDTLTSMVSSASAEIEVTDASITPFSLSIQKAF